jgi:cytochrome c biogenesis protein CcmG/thiol:disulfide interchange protein DsbE
MLSGGTARRPVWASGWLLALTFLLVFITVNAQAQASPSTGLSRPEQPAPSFTLDLFGSPERQLTLAELRGQPVIIHFCASWSSECRAEAPVLERLSQNYDYRDTSPGNSS